MIADLPTGARNGGGSRWVGAGIGGDGSGRRPGESGGAAILSSFGGDPVGAVLHPGAASSGHHHGSVTAILNRRVGFRCRHAAGGQAQAGKRRRAARCGDISLPEGDLRITMAWANC